MGRIVSIGQVLAGKYRVERILGEGGMGIVVAAYHVMLNERFALKFMLPEVASSQDAVERFLREAQAAARIKNDHVARVTDVGRLDSGEPYMVMEYLDGVDLSSHLAQNGPLPPGEAIDYVIQTCEAIEDAHSLGIIHRDLKPSNLMLVKGRGNVAWIKVLDFGISKFVNPDGFTSNMTVTKAVMGSPLYMSPEQLVSSRKVDARTDIWSLGVILYELLAGIPPFLGETQTAVAIAIATQPYPLVRRLRPELPSAIEAIIGRCLAKDRDERYESALQLADHLRRALHSPDTSTPYGVAPSSFGCPAEPMPQGTGIPTSDAIPSVGQTARVDVASSVSIWSRTNPFPSRRGRVVTVLVGSLIALGLATAAFFGLYRTSNQGLEVRSAATSSTTTVLSTHAANVPTVPLKDGEEHAAPPSASSEEPTKSPSLLIVPVSSATDSVKSPARGRGRVAGRPKSSAEPASERPRNAPPEEAPSPTSGKPNYDDM